MNMNKWQKVTSKGVSLENCFIDKFKLKLFKI